MSHLTSWRLAFLAQKQVALIARARQTLDVDDDWTLSQTLFGVTTYYRREADSSLSIKMDGELSGVALFEQVSVLKEVDLHYKWAPFCTSSLTVKDLNKIDTVGWFVIGLPQFGMARDGCFRAFGCDNLVESGDFFLVGQGVNDRDDNVPYDEEYFLEDMENVQIPGPPTRLGSGRVTIRHFSAEVHILSPASVRTRVVANINPNLPVIPQSLLEFIMRKLCGVILFKLQHAAKKAASDPVRNAHARRMRQEEAFYKGWLMPKFQSYCDHMGWTMPPIPALNLTEEQVQQEKRLTQRAVPPVRSLTTADTESTSSQDGDLHHCASAPNLLQEVDPSESASESEHSSVVSNMSGLTSVSSMFRNNPISHYLREVEARTQKEKAKKIAEGRQRAADRLRPKSISEDNQERLQQLRQAKARRLRAEGTTLPRSIPVDKSTVEESGSRFMDRIHSHGRQTRFLVTSLLVSVLLVALYSDTLLGAETLLRVHGQDIVTNLLLDFGTVVYMGIAAAMHFVMCYVSLVYAYDALDLGSKSGKRSKEYYGATIGFVVAATSASIVTLSIVKAIACVWLRWCLRYMLLGTHFVKQWLKDVLYDSWDLTWLFDKVPEPIQATSAAFLSQVSRYLTTFVHLGATVALFLQRWFAFLFVSSNIVGRGIAQILARIVGAFWYLVSLWDSYVSSLWAMYGDENVAIASWRGDAIDTARPLLTYTAVFLLSILVLFNFTARTPDTHKGIDGERTAASASSKVDSDDFEAMSGIASVPAASSTPRHDYRTQPTSSISMQEDIITEGDEALSVSMTQSFPIEAADAGRKKRLRFRLRRNKKKVVNAGGASAESAHDEVSSSKMVRMHTY